MKYASLFAGIGGFDLALNRAGHSLTYVNEWDKYAVQTYEKNFGHKPDTRDITTISTDDIPNHDILVGGFPCQSFSVAGKRGGFDDTRGTLFFEIARVLSAKRPSYLLLENVKGLLSHDTGRTFETIMRALDELGYELQWQVLNSKNFGVPQNRERVFIVGNLRGVSRPKIFPLTQSYRGHYVGCIQASYYKGWHEGSYVESEEKLEGSKRAGESAEDAIAPTLRASDHKRGDTDTVVVQRVPLKFLNRNQRNIEGDYAYTVDSMNTGGIMQLNQPKHANNRLYAPDGIAPTLNTAQGGNRQPKIPEGIKIRRLTPIECERLQGFPDNWTAGVSDTQRYKQLGNAVTVNVIEAIIKRL